MPSPALFVSNLKFRYPDQARTPDRRWTVDVAALQLAPGEQVLLTGGSGSGKSTLLQLIAGLLDPLEGTVAVAGQSIHALSGATRDRFRGSRVGMIFQTFNLLQGFTASENVQAALLFSNANVPDRRTRARDLLARLGITDVNRPVERLSVGQQQRVAVARALAVKPALVLADEPTASLDPDNAAGAIELIQSACRDNDAALLCVSHDPSMPQRFPRTLALSDLRAAARPAPSPPPAPAATSPQGLSA